MIFLVAAALTKDRASSSTLFALGAILFLICNLAGCHDILRGLSRIE
jgi:hypothetical protein